MIALALLLACAPGEEPASTHLDEAFADAASDFDVPRDLLVSVSYALTRLDDRGGAASADGAVGLMNLYLDEARSPSLAEAAELTGLDEERVETDPVANIRGGAAILAHLADVREALTGEPVDTMEEWYPVVGSWFGRADPLVAEGFAGQVFDLMETGFAVETEHGWIEVEPRVFPWRVRPLSGSSLIAQFVPASSANYTNASRGVGDIDTIVIHTTEGSYAGTISWFQNSAAGASAHYVIRSSDGQITQMVDEEDIAWHAGHWETNQRSIGIEHEGYVSDPETWYTDAMMRSSAALVRDICDRYGIPMDRSHIIGHYEVPGCPTGTGGGASCHTDPGSGWDWDYFMYLVTAEGGATEILTGGLSDGPRTGRFEAVATSSRLGITDTCSGPLSGSVSGGTLYLTATCLLDDHGDRVGELPVTFSGSVDRETTVDGRVVVEGYSDSWEGEITDDGAVEATWTGSHDLGGDVGVLTYTATIRVEPGE